MALGAESRSGHPQTTEENGGLPSLRRRHDYVGFIHTSRLVTRTVRSRLSTFVGNLSVGS